MPKKKIEKIHITENWRGIAFVDEETLFFMIIDKINEIIEKLNKNET